MRNVGTSCMCKRYQRLLIVLQPRSNFGAFSWLPPSFDPRLAARVMGNGIPGEEGEELPGDPRFTCLKQTHFGVASNFHCKRIYTLFKNSENLCAGANRQRPQMGWNPRLSTRK